MPCLSYLYVYAGDKHFPVANADLKEVKLINFILDLPSASPSASPSQPTKPPLTTHFCFKDSSDRDLPYFQGNLNKDDCYEACKAKGYLFMGKQADNECWCGNFYGKHGSSSACTNCSQQSGYYGPWVNCVSAIHYAPSVNPTSYPSYRPILQPSHIPSVIPSRMPSNQPSHEPSIKPSNMPSNKPSQRPSSRPSNRPSSSPTSHPSLRPTMQPSLLPSVKPTSVPSKQPSNRPSQGPSFLPSNNPSLIPSSRPSHDPSASPTNNPSDDPSNIPSIRSTVPNETTTFFPTQDSSLPSMTGNYVQEYAGSNGFDLLNETEIILYEASMADLAASNDTSISDVQVKVVNQEIITISNSRRLQEQDWTEMLAITYTLTVEYEEMDEITTFLQNHVSYVIEMHDEIKQFMMDQGVTVDEVITA